MKKAIRYLTYDVMDEQHAWDEHTRSIVRDRLQTTGDYQFLTTMEAEILRAWCCLLVDDHRPEMIQYVLDHIDQSLTKGLESERKPGVPSAPVLVRAALRRSTMLARRCIPTVFSIWIRNRKNCS
ncbi:hypothetical protein LJK88_01315 [Paenibacillus sp. P26]|nr:hypothetical protein LJK88_01315 [Paenibacillus sp. P26]